MNNTETNIEMYLGPMFAGKTSKLIKRLELNNILYPNYSKLYIMHTLDKEREVFSHSNILNSAIDHISVTHRDNLMSLIDENIINNGSVYSCICIDEAQFFEDLDEFIKVILEKYSNQILNVFIGGLDGTYNMAKFANSKVYDILPLCSFYKKLRSMCLVCNNNKKASFTSLRKNVEKDGEIKIGGNDTYIPVCRSCYSHLN